MSQILDFMDGKISTPEGLTVEWIDTASHADLGLVHTWVQWFMPTDQRSAFNPEAPILTKEDVEAINGDEKRRALLLKVFYHYTRYLWDNGQDWRTNPHNHNRLRITRMIRCIRLVFGYEKAQAMAQSMIRALQGKEQTATIRHWENAFKETPCLVKA